MVRFYRNVFGKGESPAAALRSAQIDMWQEPDWNFPYYWAAFVLEGEWR
jgi:CHAT domain-containing protein